jgi:hypothetical protein
MCEPQPLANLKASTACTGITLILLTSYENGNNRYSCSAWVRSNISYRKSLLAPEGWGLICAVVVVTYTTSHSNFGFKSRGNSGHHNSSPPAGYRTLVALPIAIFIFAEYINKHVCSSKLTPSSPSSSIQYLQIQFLPVHKQAKTIIRISVGSFCQGIHTVSG